MLELITFTIRFSLFFIAAMILQNGDTLQALVLAIVGAFFSLLFDKKFGSSASPKKQSKRIAILLTNHIPKTNQDKLALFAIMIAAPIALFFLTAVVLGVIFGRGAQWIWLVAAVVAIASSFTIPIARRRIAQLK